MYNSKVKIPDFLMSKKSNEDIPEVWKLLREYDRKFEPKDHFCTEGLSMSSEFLEKLADILKICLEENRTFDDVWGTGEFSEDDLI